MAEATTHGDPHRLATISAQHRVVAALPIGVLTVLCSLGTGILWNAIYFIAEREYGFTERDSLLLAFWNGVFYTAVGFGAGTLVARLERWMSPRAVLATVLLIQGFLAPAVLIFPSNTVLWVTAIVMTTLGALQWPIVQSFLVSGRHGATMRSAIGWWNASWMAATAVGLALAGPLQAMDLMRWAIPMLLPANLCAIACLAWFPSVPPHHDSSESARHVPSSYRWLLASARVLHPMGYLVIGALAPILPYLFQNLGTEPAWQAPISATWHLARFAMVIALWQTAFWHGRAWSLAVAGVLLGCGFALAVAAPNEGMLVLGLFALGLGQGAIYYSAIYYGLAVGSAGVKAGGIHEALVGAGYFMGPALGLTSLAASAGTGPLAGKFVGTFIGAVLGALVVGGLIALVRGWRARSQSIA